MIDSDYEFLEFEEFVKRGLNQMENLKEKYEITQDETYLEQYNQVKNVVSKGILLRDYCIFGVTKDDQLAFIECLSKETAKTYKRDLRKERLFTFI